MHRGDLHAILAQAIRSIKPEAVRLAEVRRTEAERGRRRGPPRKRDVANAALVIGADGIHSKVREFLSDGSRPVHRLRGMARLAADGSAARTFGTKHGHQWLGPAGHVLQYPVRRGELMNFIGFVERTDWKVEYLDRRRHDEGLFAFRRMAFPTCMRMQIRNIDIPYKWALWGRAPMQRWSAGRVTLLGDACHPTLPFLGQGAVMALEDAYVLAECLKKYASDHATALAAYENARRERTAEVVRALGGDQEACVRPRTGRHRRGHGLPR